MLVQTQKKVIKLVDKKIEQLSEFSRLFKSGSISEITKVIAKALIYLELKMEFIQNMDVKEIKEEDMKPSNLYKNYSGASELYLELEEEHDDQMIEVYRDIVGKIEEQMLEDVKTIEEMDEEHFYENLKLIQPQQATSAREIIEDVEQALYDNLGDFFFAYLVRIIFPINF